MRPCGVPLDCKTTTTHMAYLRYDTCPPVLPILYGHLGFRTRLIPPILLSRPCPLTALIYPCRLFLLAALPAPAVAGAHHCLHQHPLVPHLLTTRAVALI